MNHLDTLCRPNRSANRRDFLLQLSLGAALFTIPGLFAEELVRRTKTPRLTEGPFYPPKLPLDTDNDLILVNDSITPALGEVTHLTGRLMDANSNPIRNALVEIWQVDSSGVYLAERSRKEKYDAHFQGFGRFLTGSSGEYYFRTLKPVRYPGRQAPHIHYKVKAKGRPDFTTQLFVKDESAANLRDPIYRRIGDSQAMELVTKSFAPVENSRIGELAVQFDIVLGVTPQDDHGG